MPPSDSGSARIPLDEEYEPYLANDAATISSARTVATAANNFRVENGRTYHSFRDGEYCFPNDAMAQRHEETINHLCLMSMRDRLFLAPIGDNPKNILDIGTGIGLWAIDMADKFPSANIIGTDLSPVSTAMVPSNVTFEIDDCTADWLYPPDHFDFIHLRGLLGSIRDWPALYKQAFGHLAPGGYIEHAEGDWNLQCLSRTGEPMEPGPEIAQWYENFCKLGNQTGKTFRIAERMKEYITEAGFVDVVEQRLKWPIGSWSSDRHFKELGELNLIGNWDQGVEGWAMALYTRELNWTPEQVREFVQSVKIALRDRDRRYYHEIRVVYAKKPL
ncbi:Hypothetical protein R9X50_00443800 [Acrodontium crateriforme]|uniref:S-adenosyl-L-methionine-dependent methyltransferase n=1 Tax=Acrodontium crateriforme TaxID=150365 RepID=A0AAQ3RAT5_9PEZI|nr:Hypothetical protein R9X50_00443800 [Acrodontium crateriforme]